MTIVDRETHCFLAIKTVTQCSQEVAQQMVNGVPARDNTTVTSFHSMIA